MSQLTVAPAALVANSKTSTGTSGLAVFFIALGAFVSALAQSLLVPVLPSLPAILGTSMATAQWLITATVLVGAIAVPILGRLGDLYGTRRVLLVCLAAMAVGSLVAALASSVAWLIVGRLIQGVAAGSLPLGISLVAATVPKARQASSVALISGMLGVGGALGLPLAGLITQVASYRVLFWIAAAAAAIALVGVFFGVPESSRRGVGRLDLPGSALLTGFLLALLIPVSQAGVWGWSSPYTWGLLVLAGVLLVAFGVVEHLVVHPLVDLSTLRRRPVLAADLASVLIGFSLFGSILGTSSFVQAPPSGGFGFGASVALSGLVMLPAGLAMLVSAPIAGWLIGRFGLRATLASGGVILAGGWLTRIVAVSQMSWVVIGTAVIGLGVGLCFAALPAVINQWVPGGQNATANSLNALFRSLGVSLISALCGSILLTSLAAYRWIFALCGLGAALAAVLALAVKSPAGRGGTAPVDEGDGQRSNG